MGQISFLQIAVFTTMIMVSIDAIKCWTEKTKRHLHTFEFWVCYLIYFVCSYLTQDQSRGIIALPTLVWIWRTRTVERILSDVSGENLQRGWHYPFILSAYLLSLLTYLTGLDFIYYTLPQALACFVVGATIIYRANTHLMKKQSKTIGHALLLITTIVIFIHLLNFPFFRFDTAGAPLGYALVLMTTLLMAIILPSVTIFELQQDKQNILETVIRQRVKQLNDQAKLSSLGAMTAGIVHEINNPLSVVRHRSSFLRSQLLKNSFDRDVFLKNLDHIEITAERMAKIVNSLRKFSRGPKQEDLQVISVASIIEDTMSYCSDRFYLNTIELEVEPYPVKDLEVRPVQISQVLLNLLNNSFDAVKGRGFPWVKITFEELPDSLLIKVSDSGKGIPDDVRKKMMEPFFTTKPDGTGLGLSISKGILENHKGKLIFDEKAASTTFIMELPYRQSVDVV